MSKVFAYKVWVHIEGIDEGGDCVEGDDYYGPEEAGVFDTSDEAEDLQGFLVDVADEWRARRPSSQALLLAAAPELLAACKRVLKAIEWVTSEDRLTCVERAQVLREAIAKATEQ